MSTAILSKEERARRIREYYSDPAIKQFVAAIGRYLDLCPAKIIIHHNGEREQVLPDNAQKFIDDLQAQWNYYIQRNYADLMPSNP